MLSPQWSQTAHCNEHRGSTISLHHCLNSGSFTFLGNLHVMDQKCFPAYTMWASCVRSTLVMRINSFSWGGQEVSERCFWSYSLILGGPAWSQELDSIILLSPSNSGYSVILWDGLSRFFSERGHAEARCPAMGEDTPFWWEGHVLPSTSIPVGKTPWHPAHHQSTARTWHRCQGHVPSSDFKLAGSSPGI